MYKNDWVRIYNLIIKIKTINGELILARKFIVDRRTITNYVGGC